MKKVNRFYQLLRIMIWSLLSAVIALAGLAAGSTLVLAARPPARLGAPAAAPAGLLTGISCSASCDLSAVTGSMPAASLPGATAALPVYGYNTSGAAATAPGGPVIIANQGDPISITLHNVNLPSATSLAISGLPLIPDTAGVTAGNAKTYLIAAGVLQPGTYLYEAGLTPDGPRQAAMGLYGALIVRPAGLPSQGYTDPATAFDDEAVLVLSEIDPAFNAAPTTYDLGSFAAKYWLINGAVYPNTALINTDYGRTVLLRYVNAGLDHHSMTTSGLHQKVIATDGLTKTNPLVVMAQTIPTGTTMDALVSMPALPSGTPPPAKYPVFEAAMHLDNSGVSTSGVINFGGMMTFLSIPGAAGSGDTTGPLTSGVTFSANPANGSADDTLNASVSDVTTGNSNVTAAEYFIDSVGANGSGTGMGGAFGSPTASVTVTVTTTQLGILSSGNHTFYVHGKDSSGNWGAVSTVVLNLDKTGPTTNGMSLTPNLTNGSSSVVTVDSGSVTSATSATLVDSTKTWTLNQWTGFQVAITGGTGSGQVRAIASNSATALTVSSTWTTNPDATSLYAIKAALSLQATGTDVASGNQNVTAAEYFIGTPGANGTGTAMSLNNNAPIASLTAAIPVSAISSLSDGSIAINVHSQDALGNWGGFGTITLTVDKTGPGTSGVNANPNPNNGTLGVQITSGGAFYLRINAQVVDPAAGGVRSNIVAAEYFFDTVGANGNGGAMIPTDGAFNSYTEAVYGAVDLIHVNALSVGQHTIYVHGKDAAGNWGAFATNTFIIDKTAPATSALTTAPNPANLAATISFSVTATDPANTGVAPAVNAPASNIVGGEYYWGTTDPGVGNGTPFTIAAPAPSGTFTISGVDVSTRTIFTNNTLTVRVKDAAGNWSGVRTTSVTIDRIFANSFPSGAAPYGWSATGGTAADLSLNAGANMKDLGTNSLVATVAGGASGYVVDNLATTQGSYHARFYINPHSATLGAADTPTIFAAMNGATSVFSVQMRKNGSTYQVRLVGTTNGNWFNISNAATQIEVVRSGGTLSLYIGNVLQAQTITVLTTGINSARLGLSAGVTTAMNGSTIYFDGFVSSRTTLIGL